MGLAAARQLQRHGIPFVGFELHSDVGELWDIANPHSTMYGSAHLISSKGMTQFDEFPMADDVPPYPHHRQIGQYFRDYATHFGLRQYYQFDTRVVRLERLSASEKPRILRLAGRGDLLGLEALLPQPYAADAIACTPVQVCRIPRVLIDELTQDQPGLSRDLMKRWQRALDDADEWLTELCSGPARHRMLRLLLKLSEYAENGRVWLPARVEMGAMLDMTVETASRLVSQLKREGVLELGPARTARLDPLALQRALRDADPV